MTGLRLTIAHICYDSMDTVEDATDLSAFRRLYSMLDGKFFKISGIIQNEDIISIYIIGIGMPDISNVYYTGHFTDAIRNNTEDGDSDHAKVMKHIINRQNFILLLRSKELSNEDYVHVICGDRSYKSKKINDIFHIPYGKLVIISRESKASTVGIVHIGDDEYITNDNSYLIPIDRVMSDYRTTIYMTWPLSLMCSRRDDLRMKMELPYDIEMGINMIRYLRLINEIVYKEESEILYGADRILNAN